MAGSLFTSRFNTRVMPANERAFAFDVVLHRRHQHTDSFKARHVSPDAKVFGQDIDIRFATRYDFNALYLPKASCVIDGVTIEPEAGDRVYVPHLSRWYEINPPDDDTPAREQANPEYDWLVHVKEIDV